jgi:hypothetical protein
MIIGDSLSQGPGKAKRAPITTQSAAAAARRGKGIFENPDKHAKSQENQQAPRTQRIQRHDGRCLTGVSSKAEMVISPEVARFSITTTG